MKEPVCFRHEFRYDPAEWPDCKGFTLAIDTKLPRVEAWLNGKPLEVPPGPKKELSLEIGAVRRGSNLLAVLVGPSDAPPEEVKKAAAAGGKAQRVALAAELSSRPGDEILSRDQLEQLGLFKALSKMPGVEEYPGSIVLRRYNKGDVVCFQGEPGSSAFYILSAEDLLEVRKQQLRFFTDELRDVTLKDLKAFSPKELLELQQLRRAQIADIEKQRAEAKRGRLEPETEQRLATLRAELEQLDTIAPLARRVTALAGTDPRGPERLAANALILQGNTRVRPVGVMSRLKQKLFGGGSTAMDEEPVTIRNDGPSDISYKTRTAPMYEGDLFGEMACMTNAPRSATVVADRDGYMLEFLKNVFNLIQKDDGYRERMLATYRTRVLSSHLQKLKIFKHVKPARLAQLGQTLDMRIVDAGTVIFNEGEPSDCVYIIRTGLVQVVRGIKGVNVALNDDAVKDWTAFAREILKGDPGVFVPCPQCRHELRLPDRTMLGRFGRCPSCKHKFLLVDPAEMEEVELEEADPETMTGLKAPLATAKAAAKPAGAAAVAAKPGAAKPAPAAKPAAPAAKADPAAYQAVWEELAAVQPAVRRVASNVGTADDRVTILIALNTLIKSREFVNIKELGSVLKNDEVTASFPRNKKQWTGLQICIAGRLMIQELYKAALKDIPKSKSIGPLEIRAYLGGGDVFGESGVIKGLPRSATCIAYDHPVEEGASRAPGQVELIVIKADVFRELLKDSPETEAAIVARVDETERLNAERESLPVFRKSNSIINSPEFQDQGFIQGQKLMLIDLDSCTRCGDCVRACIETHDDGYTRLFLDGPRFDRFLVPSACRNCIDPACMIGCPVGSIQRGDDGQIVIRDWCIGCNTCARQCPYDSIQMHDTGVVGAEAPGWRFAPESAAAGRKWHKPRFGDSAWTESRGPFLWDLEFQEGLAAARGSRNGQPPAGPEAPLKYRDTVLSLRLDVDRKPPMPPGVDDPTIELRLRTLPQIAVVCDQCSTRPNKEPACVEYCPHEAAMRVDARSNFPIGMSG